MMNKPFLKIKLVTALFSTCLFIASCSDDDNNVTLPQNLTQEDVMKSLEVDAISNFIDNMTLNNISFNRSTPSISSKNNGNDCITFAATDTGYTLSFTDCTFGDNTVNGSMAVNVTIDNRTVISTITFDNLSYGGNQINGNKTTTYSLDTIGGTFMYSVTSDLSIALDDGTTASENGTKTYEVTGLGTAEGSYTISGNWNVTINADSYSLSTNPDLKGTFDCDHITEGTLIITKNDMTASIDYGDGTCDNKAMVTYPDGTSEEIEL